MRLDSKIAAAAGVALAGVYMVASIVTGRPARAEPPLDLAPRGAEVTVDAWKAAKLLVDEPRTAILDVRPADAYARYHLPGAASLPGASPEQVHEALRAAPAAIVYAGKDEVAQRLAGAVRAADPGARVHVLADGARAWYLAFQLPVPLFSDTAPPAGYGEALAAVATYLERRDPSARAAADAGLQALAKASYQPNLLQGAKRQAAPGGGKKKLAGGCG